MIDCDVRYAGKIEHGEEQLHSFAVKFTLKPTTIAEAKIRGLDDQLDLATTVTVKFSLRDYKARGRSDADMFQIGAEEARRLLAAIVR